MTETTYTADTFDFEVPVTSSGSEFDLTDCTTEVIAGNPTGPSVVGTSSVPAPVTGVIKGSFAANSLSAGPWTIQVAVRKSDGQRKTVTEIRLNVLQSH